MNLDFYLLLLRKAQTLKQRELQRKVACLTASTVYPGCGRKIKNQSLNRGTVTHDKKVTIQKYFLNAHS